MKKLLCVMSVSLCLLSCGGGDRRLKMVLRLADENRAGLESVLEHYADEPLKLRAAEFLITNMPGHNSFDSEEIEDFAEEYKRIMFDSLLTANRKMELLKELSDRHDLLASAVPDLHVITADFLIDNIDRSFEIWESEPYCQHLNFDEFCELILPYKCVEYQALDDWKTELSKKFNQMYTVDSNDEISHSAFNAARLLIIELKTTYPLVFSHGYDGYTYYDKSTLADIEFGTCENYARTAIAIMRSKGIPACYEWTPQWAQGPEGHSWHTILNDNGVNMPSPWIWQSFPGDVFFPTQRMPKIFRETYAANPFFEEYQYRSKLKLSKFHKFQKDVTDLYIGSDDLVIPVETKEIKEKYAYLAIFDNEDWNVIDLGVIKRKKARFGKAGRNVAYIVMGFDGAGLVPISRPFILTSAGEVEYCIPETDSLEEVKLRRKYPRDLRVANQERNIVDGQIHAANRADFSDADTLYVIESLEYPDMIPVDTSKHYRYLRLCQGDPVRVCSLSELQFYAPGNSETPLTGRIIASDEDLESGASELGNVFDGDWLTSYTSYHDDAWVGLDLGKPVAIDKVRVVPRSDDNAIHYGDTYELKYWDDGWVSLGEQMAKGKELVYGNVPGGALLLLSNNTRGSEERVFTLKSGEVMWW